MGTFSFVSFIITLSIILTNEFDGIDAGRPKDEKKPLPPTVDWRSKLVLKIILQFVIITSELEFGCDILPN